MITPGAIYIKINQNEIIKQRKCELFQNLQSESLKGEGEKTSYIWKLTFDSE